eukprot:6045060-Pleurochrysis_carterae.AAC.1
MPVERVEGNGRYIIPRKEPGLAGDPATPRRAAIFVAASGRSGQRGAKRVFVLGGRSRTALGVGPCVSRTRPAGDLCSQTLRNGDRFGATGGYNRGSFGETEPRRRSGQRQQSTITKSLLKGLDFYTQYLPTHFPSSVRLAVGQLQPADCDAKSTLTTSSRSVNFFALDACLLLLEFGSAMRAVKARGNSEGSVSHKLITRLLDWTIATVLLNRPEY